MNITIARNMYETLVNQFLVITAETDILDYIEDSHRNKLNGLLNELNCLDYKSLQIADSKVTFDAQTYFTPLNYCHICLVDPLSHHCPVQHSNMRGHTYSESLLPSAGNDS